MRTTRNEVAIEIVGLNKWFGAFHVLRDLDLKVMRGERIVICGPSGSGKSTLLRCINRLEDWQRGRVVVRAESRHGTHVLFQSTAAPRIVTRAASSAA